MRASVQNTQPFTEKAVMLCKSCASENQTECGTEIMIHFSGLKNLDKFPISVFPKLLICLDCGFTEFTIPETELRLLGESGVASAAA
jgi:hypothetical protein